MSAKAVQVTLTVPQAEAILTAIAEVTAGETDLWPTPRYKALLRAEDKIAAAIGAA